jgi:hypothetical protein
VADFQQYSSGGFPYGINWSKPPESIADGELAQALNCEYGVDDGALRTVAGVRVFYCNARHVISSDDSHTVFAGLITSMHHDAKSKNIYMTSNASNESQVLFTCHETDWDIKNPKFFTMNMCYRLSGSKFPVYAAFGDVTLVATGGVLQYVTAAGEVHNVDSGPVCDYVTVRSGRVVAYAYGDDELKYSAVGDYTSWKTDSNNKSSAQYVKIGYKDSGSIVAIDFLSKALIVYKDNGHAYRIVSEPQDSDFSIQPISQTAYCISPYAVCNIDSKAYYLGNAGFMSFQPTAAYGDIEPFQEGLNINSQISSSVDESCRMWRLPSRKQIWIKPSKSSRIYIYHYIPRYPDGRGAFTVRDFSYEVNDLMELDGKIYIAYYNKIGILDETLDTDDDNQIETVIMGGNKLTSKHTILVMNRNFVCNNILPGQGIIQCGKKPKPITFQAGSTDIYGDADDIAGSTSPIDVGNAYTRSYKVSGGSCKSVQPLLHVETGAVSLKTFDYKYLEV